jgi:hypothetical protein
MATFATAEDIANELRAASKKSSRAVSEALAARISDNFHVTHKRGNPDDGPRPGWVARSDRMAYAMAWENAMADFHEIADDISAEGDQLTHNFTVIGTLPDGTAVSASCFTTYTVVDGYLARVLADTAPNAGPQLMNALKIGAYDRATHSTG